MNKDNNNISIICSTSTLAVGVNLPCYLVILKGTQGYSDSGPQEYSSLEVMQMLGRAGRPQFENEACAVILCLNDKVSKYEKMVAGTEILESSLHLNLIEHLNAEISLGTVNSMASAKKWISGTFLNVRLQQNPQYYKLESEKPQLTHDELLLQWCEKDLDLLRKTHLIEDDDTLRSTDLGHTMARYCVKFETMKTFMTVLARAKISEILNALCQAVEFRDFRFRNGEKGFYKDLNKANEIRYPIQVDIAQPQHKVSLMIQAKLGCVVVGKDAKTKVDGGQLSGQLRQLGQDTNGVINHAKRLIRCMVDIFVQRNDSYAVKSALELARSLAAGVWDGTVMQLKQVPGLGDVSTRKLAAAGIKDIDSLFNTEPSRIEVILSKHPPFGLELIKKVAEFPMLHISMSERERKHIPGKGAEIKVYCEVGFFNQKTPLKFNKRLFNVLFVCETTHGELIDFRRFKPPALNTAGGIHLSAIIGRPGTKLRCHVMCDDLAGTHRYAELDINCPDSWFPPKVNVHETNHQQPQLQFARPVLQATEEFDSEGVDDNDFLAAACETPVGKVIEDIDDIMSEPDDHEGSRKRSVTTSLTEQGNHYQQPQKLDNGKWTCQHNCRSQGKQCKHTCCLEGVKKKGTKKRPRKEKEMHNSDSENLVQGPAKKKIQKQRNQDGPLDKMLQKSGKKISSNTKKQRTPTQAASTPNPAVDVNNAAVCTDMTVNHNEGTLRPARNPPSPQQVSDVFDIGNYDWQVMDEVATKFGHDHDMQSSIVVENQHLHRDQGSQCDSHHKKDNIGSENHRRASLNIPGSNLCHDSTSQDRLLTRSSSKDTMSSGVPAYGYTSKSTYADVGQSFSETGSRNTDTPDTTASSTHLFQAYGADSMNQAQVAPEDDYERAQRLAEEDQRRIWAELGSKMFTYETHSKYWHLVDDDE